jgi:hypothetical protein
MISLKNFTFSAEVGWFHLSQGFGGRDLLAWRAAAGPDLDLQGPEHGVVQRSRSAKLLKQAENEVSAQLSLLLINLQGFRQCPAGGLYLWQ